MMTSSKYSNRTCYFEGDSTSPLRAGICFVPFQTKLQSNKSGSWSFDENILFPFVRSQFQFFRTCNWLLTSRICLLLLTNPDSRLLAGLGIPCWHNRRWDFCSIFRCKVICPTSSQIRSALSTLTELSLFHSCWAFLEISIFSNPHALGWAWCVKAIMCRRVGEVSRTWCLDRSMLSECPSHTCWKLGSVSRTSRQSTAYY